MNKIEKRREILAEVFQAKLNQSIPYSEFQAALRKHNVEVEPRAIQHTFAMWRDQFIPGLVIEKIGREEVLITESARTILDDRKKANAGIKKRLGAALWDYLIEPVIPWSSQQFELRGYPDHCRRKLAAFRQKTNPIVCCDAGSSTESAIEQLMAVDSFPIRGKVKPDGGKGAGVGSRFVMPTIVTNSLPIVDRIAKSVSQESTRELECYLIGGKFRFQRGSFVGSLAQACLRSWQLFADVALIGTTGYRIDHAGTPSFGCDNLSEAHMKAALLSNAWLKIVILDSSKLATNAPSSLFVPLSYPSLDLIVCDDGVDKSKGRGTEAERNVNALCEAARLAGVECCIVPKMENASKDVSGNKSSKKAKPGMESDPQGQE